MHDASRGAEPACGFDQPKALIHVYRIGDKAGDWRGWYRKAIPCAEQLYAEHIETISARKDGGR
jgi:hypothetical protein